MIIPNFANDIFSVSGSYTGTIKSILLFGLLPFAFYFILALPKIIIAKSTWKDAFTQLVLAILPITASMHLLKAFLKTTSRIPYWNYKLSDPIGVDTANLIIEKLPAILSTDNYTMDAIIQMPNN